MMNLPIWVWAALLEGAAFGLGFAIASLIPLRFQRWFPGRVLTLLCAGAVSGMVGWFLFRQYGRLQSPASLGVFHQALWNISHTFSLKNSLFGGNALGYHFSPIILLFAPIYWIFPDARVLLGGTAGLLFMAAAFLFLWARRMTDGTGFPWAIGLVFLLSPFTHRALLEGFDPIFCFAAFFFLLLWSDNADWRWVYAFAVLACLAAGKDFFLLLLPVAIWQFFEGRTGRGAFTLTALLAWGVALHWHWLPVLRSLDLAGLAQVEYTRPGSGLLDIARTPLTVLKLVEAHIQVPAVYEGWLVLIISLSGLPLLSVRAFSFWVLPWLGAVIYPMTLRNALGDSWGLTVLTFAIAGSVQTMAALQIARMQQPLLSARLKGGFSFALAASALFFCAFVSPFRNHLESWFSKAGMERVQAVQHIQGLLPKEASIAASENLLPQLKGRGQLFLYPEVERAGFIVLDLTAPPKGWDLETYRSVVAALKDSPGWQVNYEGYQFLILRKK